MYKRKISAVVIVALMAVMVSGCAMPKSPEGKYLAARVWFNNNAERLVDYRDLQDPEEQARLNELILPKLEVAVAFLDAWALALMRPGRTNIGFYETLWADTAIRILSLVNELLPGDK
ncbi:hypothetical protein LCGC14_1170030 [marine sediment metagenome]|uniref:Uncharacterized protein n=1 Tax=marine sediment metagenome TaxID=412755 RepID=A0A0F9P886_9ZZZZ